MWRVPLVVMAVFLSIVFGLSALDSAGPWLRQQLARLPLPVGVWHWLDSLVQRLFTGPGGQ